MGSDPSHHETAWLSSDTPAAVPLVYPGNLREGVVRWPRDFGKAQGFLPREPKDEKLLVPAGNYVLVKRLSSKEGRRRVVASVWETDQSEGPVAFENHVNVFHHDGAGLDLELAVGLSYWLNSTVIDC